MKAATREKITSANLYLEKDLDSIEYIVNGENRDYFKANLKSIISDAEDALRLIRQIEDLEMKLEEEIES